MRRMLLIGALAVLFGLGGYGVVRDHESVDALSVVVETPKEVTISIPDASTITGDCVTVIYSDLSHATAHWNEIGELDNFKEIVLLSTWRKKDGIATSFRDDHFWSPNMGWEVYSFRYLTTDKLQIRRSRESPPMAHQIVLGKGAGGSFASRLLPAVHRDAIHAAAENVFVFVHDEALIPVALALYDDTTETFATCN